MLWKIIFFSSESTQDLTPESESDPEEVTTEEEQERLVIYEHMHSLSLSLFSVDTLYD